MTISWIISLRMFFSIGPEYHLVFKESPGRCSQRIYGQATGFPNELSQARALGILGNEGNPLLGERYRSRTYSMVAASLSVDNDRLPTIGQGMRASSSLPLSN